MRFSSLFRALVLGGAAVSGTGCGPMEDPNADPQNLQSGAGGGSDDGGTGGGTSQGTGGGGTHATGGGGGHINPGGNGGVGGW